MTLVSVIIPYFKKKKYIESTLNSVLSQTYRNLEIILIYDDESEADLDFIKKLSNIDKRIKLIINSKNLGAGESRNTGITSCNGEYCAFLDSDDTWHSKKIELQLNFMKKNGHICTHTSYGILIDYKISSIRIARDFVGIKSLLKSCDIGLSTVMLKKEVISNECKFPKTKTKEDFILWLKILNEGISIKGMNNNLAIWRQTKYSLSSYNLQKLKDGFNVYYKYMNYNIFKSTYLLLCLCFNFFKKK
mgnify:FL=1|jgi:teichuronic acid biosynthesis glycosyltransferase TuaG|tara:strand:- start:140 stop:880 length:741 start_codon:yes stop_codon:yes gene_type:complete